MAYACHMSLSKAGKHRLPDLSNPGVRFYYIVNILLYYIHKYTQFYKISAIKRWSF